MQYTLKDHAKVLHIKTYVNAMNTKNICLNYVIAITGASISHALTILKHAEVQHVKSSRKYKILYWQPTHRETFFPCFPD